jgi:hypothetical protein
MKGYNADAQPFQPIFPFPLEVHIALRWGWEEDKDLQVTNILRLRLMGLSEPDIRNLLVVENNRCNHEATTVSSMPIYQSHAEQLPA